MNPNKFNKLKQKYPLGNKQQPYGNSKVTVVGRCLCINKMDMRVLPASYILHHATKYGYYPTGSWSGAMDKIVIRRPNKVMHEVTQQGLKKIPTQEFHQLEKYFKTLELIST